MSNSKSKVARMLQPESLKSTAYQPWSRGRGVDVWAMLCASITGDLESIKKLVRADPNLVECEYEYFKTSKRSLRCCTRIRTYRSTKDWIIRKSCS
jgi:hypothetical protein